MFTVKNENGKMILYEHSGYGQSTFTWKIGELALDGRIGRVVAKGKRSFGPEAPKMITYIVKDLPAIMQGETKEVEVSFATC